MIEIIQRESVYLSWFLRLDGNRVMLEGYLIRGILIGLIFGVPAGAIGALTIQRTLRDGFAAGLATGLGSSAADLLYLCV